MEELKTKIEDIKECPCDDCQSKFEKYQIQKLYSYIKDNER